MKLWTAALFLVSLLLQAYAAPQFITYKDGKLGVNFMGYHAGVGIGGLLGDNAGAAGKLYAEAGTPTGQLARAGLGGTVDEKGRASGGLFAGATAGGNVHASAGLAGGVNENKAEGAGFAAAQAGKHVATSGLGGQSSNEGSSGFSIASNNDVALPVDKDKEISPVIKSTANFEVNAHSDIEKNEPTADEPSVIVKEVYAQPKLKHHHRVKPVKNYYSHIQEPIIEKRIDVDAESSLDADAAVAANTGANVNQIYTKQVTVQRNPTFFRDIFSIPISAITAVRNLFGNVAENTNISVQKAASVNAETDIESTKSAHSPTLSKSSQSSAHISVETPSAAKFLDDIFAIPLDTLGAVNTFLENNVPAKKTIQAGGSGEIRLRGPARRRANKQEIIENLLQQTTENSQYKQ